MLLKNKIRKAVGLDIGSSTIKAAELSWSKEKGVSLVSHKQIKLRAEGILDEEELSQTLSSWFDSSGWKSLELCSGMPQYLSTVQVMDFPEAPAAKLDEMIAYETRQLSGVSEETFIHDYHVMPPKYGRKNPVLIGISRHSVIMEKLHVLDAAGICPSDITMNSMALMNTLFRLHPTAKDVNNPQMIVDVGAENSTVVIFAGGQILSISSLLFGSDKYTRALSELLKLDEAKAEEEKLKTKVDPDDEEHPFYHVSMSFITELENAVEQWKTHENSETAGMEFSKIWLCGGGALTDGLPDMLKANFTQCDNEVFGPQDTDGKILPELVTAYGLALQALKMEDVDISLAPSEISWLSQRKRNFKFLSAAAVLLIISICVYLAGYYMALNDEDAANMKLISSLKICEERIPDLERLGDDIRHFEKMIAPFAIKGGNIPRFLTALREIGKIKGDDFFFIYLADEKSFNGLKLEKTAPKEGQGKIFFNPLSKEPGAFLKRGKPESVSVSAMVETRSLVLLGFTITATKKEHYDLVRQIQTKLNQLPLFSSGTEEVDILSEEDRMGREDVMSSPWISQVVNSKDINAQLGGKRFRDFAIKLPFAEENVNKANLQETKTKEKKK